MPDTVVTQRSALRQELRARRAALSLRQQSDAAEALARRLTRQPLFRRCHRLGLYWPMEGEVDPRLLLFIAVSAGKRCYLPALNRFRRGTLEFRPYRPGDRMKKNRFGIPEPQTKAVQSRQLDLVLVPLVGFDRHGNRLGMGGGFYDRSFAFKRSQSAGLPVLIGIAHSCQEMEQLPVASWDVPLQGVITERGILAKASRRGRDFLASDCLVG